MNDSGLGRLLQTLLRASLGAPLLIGCSVVDTSSYALPHCTNGQLSLKGVSMGQFSSLTLNREFDFTDAGPTVIDEVGVRCANAADMLACQNGFAALATDAGFHNECSQICVRYWIAGTDPQGAKKIDTPDQFKALLGTIDSPQEAALLAWNAKYAVGCGPDKSRGGVKPVAGGFEVIGTRGSTCGRGDGLRQHVLHISADGTLTETTNTQLAPGDPNCAIGRRPGGLCATGAHGATPLGRHFARAAQLEAASVFAFLRLRDELHAHGVRGELLERATRSAAEEVTHTFVTERLAHRFGGVTRSPRVSKRAVPSLEQIATENAVEGCVRETYGAYVALRQAQVAGDPNVRAALGGIAVDEVRHAELSWALDVELQRRLGRSARRRLLAARAEAFAELKTECARTLHPSLVDEGGMPSADEAVATVERLARAV